MSSPDSDDRTVETNDYENERYDDDRTVDTRDEYGDREQTTGRRDDGHDEDYFLGLSLGALLLLGGIALFLFPEPATSTVGIVLAVVGALVLVYDALR